MSIKSLSEKRLSAMIERTYYNNFSGVQIPIMTIPRIVRVARSAYREAEASGSVNAQALMTIALRGAVESVWVQA